MFSEQLLEQFVLMASDRIDGDWVLCGASILPLMGIKARTTWDIDFFGISNPSQKEIHKLMEVAELLGIPPECINLSGGYYFSKKKSFLKHLILMQEGKNSKIFRPDLFLFVQLKLQRFTEVDLMDCVEFANHEIKNKSNFSKSEIETSLKEILLKTKQPEKAKRIVQLMQTFAN